jgi:hypothetical protein
MSGIIEHSSPAIRVPDMGRFGQESELVTQLSSMLDLFVKDR